MNPMSRRIVVTGLGAVTPLGEDFPISWKCAHRGTRRRRPARSLRHHGLPLPSRRQRQSCLPCPIFRQSTRRLARASRLAIPAAREALASAGLLDAEGRSLLRELPFSVSTTAGGMAFGEDFLRRVLAHNRRTVAPIFSARSPAICRNSRCSIVQQALGFAGHSVIIANACASGANAIGHAADLISVGAADCVLAGGFEALTELVFVGFDCLQATSIDRCRPFDLNRSGLLLGEAAAFLVLESGEHAQRRGATPLCQLTGYGHTTDFFHLTQPQPDGAALVEVMRAAATQARIAPAQIGYINAHGTATPVNDGVEAKAYGAFLGDALGSTRISSTKAAIGHTLGAAGAVEALFAIEALRTGHLPPQLNLQTPIPEIAPALVGEKESSRDMRHVMSVNLGFGGSNAALIFSRNPSP
jgi:3-oxoacyl-[acyl-carrier-protein] synthase II